MKLGSTGTQLGMSNDQKAVFTHLVTSWLKDITEYHHGNCIGSDCESVHIIYVNVPDAKIFVHPSNIKDKQCSFNQGYFYLAKPPLVRNHDIVDDIDTLIATPKKYQTLHSGTWATFRYAEKKKREIYIIYPDGTTNYIHFPYGKKEICDFTLTKCPICRSFNYSQVPDGQFPILECNDCHKRWFSD